MQRKVAGPGGWHAVYNSNSQGLSVNRSVYSFVYRLSFYAIAFAVNALRVLPILNLANWLNFNFLVRRFEGYFTDQIA